MTKTRLTLLVGAQMVVPAGSLRSCWRRGEVANCQVYVDHGRVPSTRTYQVRAPPKPNACRCHASTRTASVALAAFTSSR